MKRPHIAPSLTVALTSLGLLFTSIGVFSAAEAVAQEAVAQETATQETVTQETAAEPTEGQSPEKEEEEKAKVKTDAETDSPEATPVPPSDDEAIPTEEERVAAMTAFQTGELEFANEKFSAAAEHFKAAYDIIPSPHAEYWIALCLDKADKAQLKVEATLGAYETFLSNSGALRVGKEQVDFAKERVDELQKLMPASVTLISSPSGASLVIDNKAQEKVTPLTVELAPGPHTITFSRDGFEKTVVELELEGGTKLEQQVELNELPQAAKPEEKPQADEPESMIPAYVTLGIAGAGLVTGTTFGILALTGKNKYNETPTSAQADRVERNALIADMSLSVAVTLGITSYILFRNASKSRKEKLAALKKREQFIVAPFATRTSGGAAARVKF